MRLDQYLDRDRLQPRQLFFVECWASLTNQNNIDSDRVTYSNPLSVIDELLGLYNFGDKYRAKNKREHVRAELIDMLKRDLYLKSDCFQNIPHEILTLIETSHNVEDLEKKSVLMISFLTQFKELLYKNYRQKLVEGLRGIFFEAEELTDEVCDEIYYLTNMLISTLLTLGMPLSECYLLYRNFLKRRKTDFNTDFEFFLGKICLDFKTSVVSIKLESDKFYSLIERSEGSIVFKNSVFHLVNHPKKNTVAVNIEVEAISLSSAHSKAIADLGNYLDIITYMTGRSDIVIKKKYSAKFKNDAGEFSESKELNYFDQPLKNASDRLGADEFQVYIHAMSRLHENANEETVKKVSSVFRFFRNGIADSTLESQFTALWSALESLTIGVSKEDLSHDEQVIASVLPSVSLDYPVKQLFALRGVAKALNWEIFDFDDINIDFKIEDLGLIYQSLKNEKVVEDVYIRLNDYPYAKYRFKSFIEQCASPHKLGFKMQEHRKKVQLQIHRLYRTRNAIVHNATTQNRLDMLVVNLEHYLRSTLNAMVYMMELAPTINSPEEAFNRYQFHSDSILKELDPSFLVTPRGKREGIRKELDQGTLSGGDSNLFRWLSLHT